jgi:hypothetical protein
LIIVFDGPLIDRWLPPIDRLAVALADSLGNPKR